MTQGRATAQHRHPGSERGPRRGTLVRVGIGLIVLLVSAGCAPAPKQAANVVPAVRVALPEPKLDIEARRREFFEKVVLPNLQELERRNDEAAVRCIDRIRAAFRRYRRGVPQFVDDVMSWRTRFGVLCRLPRELILKDNCVQKYIQPKFERYVFSQRKLRKDLDDALRGYREDVRANLSISMLP